MSSKVEQFGEVFRPVTQGPTSIKNNKVTVVGVGSVGMAAAFAIMSKSIAESLVLYDIIEDKVNGEVLDMEQGSQFLESCEVSGGTDITKTANSDIILITAGARQAVGESRLNLVQRNYDIFKKLIPQLCKHSPNAILVVVSNPVDIMTYITWKISGFPEHRVIGSGTLLDSARFRHILGKKLHLNASAIHGYVIGEHGDSSVPVWSSVSVGGVKLADVYPTLGTPEDPNDFNAVHKAVVSSAYDIISLKGYTSWAIGLCCASLCQAILHNRHVVIPVSTSLKGMYGITDPIFTSIPCAIDAKGITSTINLKLSSSEQSRLLESVKSLKNTLDGLNW